MVFKTTTDTLPLRGHGGQSQRPPEAEGLVWVGDVKAMKWIPGRKECALDARVDLSLRTQPNAPKLSKLFGVDTPLDEQRPETDGE